MKLQEKVLARALRKKGYGYNVIQNKLHVSKSTLSHWLRDIRLSRKQIKRLLNQKRIGAYKGAKIKQKKRLKDTKVMLKLGEKEFYTFLKDPLFLIGLSLYWAEGDKNKSEAVKFTNSDPAMIHFMMRWFRRICNVPKEKFRIALNIHNLHISKNVKNYWSKVTGIQHKQFYKTYIKPTSLRFKRNILYNGTCAIRVNDVNLFRRILGWRKGLLKYFKIPLRSSMDRTKDF